MSWRTLPTHSRIELVKEHWCSGYSASDIARSLSARMGEAISRNSICGIYHRHADQLTKHPLQVSPWSKTTGKQSVCQSGAKARIKQAAFKPPKPVRSPIAAPQSRFVPLLDLRANECRWPVNDARVGETHLFCGCETNPLSSWCEFHADLVFDRTARKSA